MTIYQALLEIGVKPSYVYLPNCYLSNLTVYEDNADFSTDTIQRRNLWKTKKVLVKSKISICTSKVGITKERGIEIQFNTGTK